MKLKVLIPCALAGLCALSFATANSFVAAPRSAQDGGEEEMAAAMAKMAKFTQPGENHKVLERFLGKWDTEVRFTMGGSQSPPSKGTSETKWLHNGRWITTSWSSDMMGMSVDGPTIMGYDNFKQSFVATSVSTMDTAMNSNEGDLNQKGDVLLMYGTIDEYLDGQLDKMSKTVYRFLSPDKIVMEVHDFAIGETDTMVVQVTFNRAK